MSYFKHYIIFKVQSIYYIYDIYLSCFISIIIINLGSQNDSNDKSIQENSTNKGTWHLI